MTTDPIPSPRRPDRAFFALDVGPQALAALRKAQASLASHWPASVLFVPEPRLHITLRFLGHLDPKTLAALDALLQSNRLRGALEYHPPFTLGLNGSGAFPDPVRPSVLWAGVGGQIHELQRLQAFVAGVAAALDLPPADHPFLPHITLGRLYRWPQADAEAEQVRASLAGRRSGWPFRDPPRDPSEGQHHAQYPWVVPHLHLMRTADGSGDGSQNQAPESNTGNTPHQTLFTCPLRPARQTTHDPIHRHPPPSGQTVPDPIHRHPKPSGPSGQP